MTLQSVEMTAPVAAIPLDPFVDLHESVGPQRIDAALRVGPDLDETDFAQHPQVSRNGRLGQLGKCRDEFTGCPFALGKHVEERAPAGFGYGFENIHVAEYRKQSI